MKITKRLCILITILLLFCSLLVGCIGPNIMGAFIESTYANVALNPLSAPIHIEGEHPANYQQTDAGVNLSAYNEHLYFLMDHSAKGATEHTCHLGVLTDTGGHILDDYEGLTVDVAFWNDSVYYLNIDAQQGCFVLYRYIIPSGETVMMEATTAFTGSVEYPFQIGSDNVLYLVADRAENSGYPIHDSDVAALTTIPCSYEVGDLTYTMGATSDEELVCVDPQGNSTTVPLAASEKSLVPYQDGLLVLNTTDGNTLHYITPTGDVIELFRADDMHAESAVNFHGDYVFLSLQRYESWNGRAGTPAENDPVNGTYRIDMRDYSVEKISDTAYDGLYIFNGTGIYATDRFANVYQLDFNGALVEHLIRVGD